MADGDEERNAERIDRLVSGVIDGRHLKATPSDAAEHETIMMAARLAGSREGYPRMSPAFRRRLARLLEKGEAPKWLSRRAALVGGLGLAAGAVGGALASEANRMVGVMHPKRLHVDPLPPVARWVDTGLKLGDLEVGVPQRVTAGAVGAFVVRTAHGVAAMSAYCTHLPCELVWQSDVKVLNCPCHNVAFDVAGNSLADAYPPLSALPVVNVRVGAGGRIEVLGT